jgi:hypothetical protein
MENLNANHITESVLERLANAPDPGSKRSPMSFAKATRIWHRTRCLACANRWSPIGGSWPMALTNSILTLCSTRSEALTTFSSFSAEVVATLQQGRFTLAAGTASLHFFGSLALTVLGLKTVALL